MGKQAGHAVMLLRSLRITMNLLSFSSDICNQNKFLEGAEV